MGITVSPVAGVMQQASSSINLTCVVSGTFHPPLSYQWTSTCMGDCFVLLGRTQTLTESSLHSIDSGNHTCSVTDALGNSGMATTEIRITGKKKIVIMKDKYNFIINNVGSGLSYIGRGLLENNTFITADSDGMINDFHCSSDSTMANIGHWIGPNGMDLTNSTTDPFVVSRGNEQDPGSLVVQLRNGHIVTRSFQGIYTCIIQNDNGVQSYIHVGIYQNGFNSKSYN